MPTRTPIDERKILFSRKMKPVYACKIKNTRFGTFDKCVILHETDKAVLVKGVQESGKPSGMVYVYNKHWIPKRFIEIDGEIGDLEFNFVPTYERGENQGFYTIKRKNSGVID